MPRPAATAEERSDQRRRLRRAASELHREGGLKAVTVRAVTKRAGVSTGLLYSYYANLSDLMRSLWTVPIGRLSDSMATVEEAEADPTERIRQLLAAYVDFAVSDTETHRGLLLFVRPPDSTTDLAEDPNDLILFAALRRAVEAGQTAGSIRAGDAATLCQMLWSGVHSALALPINIDTYTLADGPTIAHEMIDALVRSISTTTPANEEKAQSS